MKKFSYLAAVGMIVMSGLLAGCGNQTETATGKNDKEVIVSEEHDPKNPMAMTATPSNPGEKTVEEMQKVDGSKMDGSGREDEHNLDDIDLDANEPGADDFHKKDVDWEDVSAPLEREMESWD